MQIDIYDIEKFIKVNDLKEITNPIIMERDNIPTRDGLLSMEIFGRTVDERRSIFAYINLNGFFFHPLLYKTLKRVDNRIEKIVNGEMFVSINSKGELVEDEENGETGIEFLYKNFDKIKYQKNDSNIRNQRVDFINALGKNEKFTQYWIVCPAFFRDLQTSKSNTDTPSYGELNQPYSKLIRLASALKNDVSGISVVGNMTRAKIQNLIVEIYDYITAMIKGKNGMFRQFVLGKSVDNGVRAVISCPIFKAERPRDMDVDFYKCGLPLAMATTTFYPFVLKWIKDFFNNELVLRKDKYPVMTKDGKVDYVKLTEVEMFNDEYITKNVDLFIHSYADRFKKIPLKNDKGYNIFMRLSGRYTNGTDVSIESSTVFNRAMTWTDLLYLACYNVCKDKHVIITRYPLEDYFGIFANKITVMSTVKTTPVIISGVLYEKYPVIDLDAPTSKVATMFVDTLNISNLYLQGLGGDYDGDQVTVRGAFTQESNQELNDLILAKSNILNIYGSSIRSTEKEAIQTLYSFTKKR